MKSFLLTRRSIGRENLRKLGQWKYLGPELEDGWRTMIWFLFIRHVYALHPSWLLGVFAVELTWFVSVPPRKRA